MSAAVPDGVFVRPAGPHAPAQLPAVVPVAFPLGEHHAAASSLVLAAAVHIPRLLHDVFAAALVAHANEFHAHIVHVVERDVALRTLIADIHDAYLPDVCVAVGKEHDADLHSVQPVLCVQGCGRCEPRQQHGCQAVRFQCGERLLWKNLPTAASVTTAATAIDGQ